MISACSRDAQLLTRNSLNGYVATAGGIQETELEAQTKHRSAKH